MVLHCLELSVRNVELRRTCGELSEEPASLSRLLELPVRCMASSRGCVVPPGGWVAPSGGRGVGL